MPKKNQEKQLADLLKKAAFADKVLKLAVKAGLTEPAPKRSRARVVVQTFGGVTAAAPTQARVEKPDFIRCEGCNSLIPDDAYETHSENCTEARGRAHQD